MGKGFLILGSIGIILFFVVYFFPLQPHTIISCSDIPDGVPVHYYYGQTHWDEVVSSGEMPSGITSCEDADWVKVKANDWFFGIFCEPWENNCFNMYALNQDGLSTINNFRR